MPARALLGGHSPLLSLRAGALETSDPSPEVEAAARKEVDGGEAGDHLKQTTVEIRAHRSRPTDGR